MPCEYYSESDRQQMRNDEYRKMAENVDKLTRMMCKICSTFESEGYKHIDPEIDGWWVEHKKLDAIRIKAEKKIAKRLK